MVALLSVAEVVSTTLQLMIAATVMLREKKLGALYNVAEEEVTTPKQTFAAKERCGPKNSRKIPSAVAVNDTTPTAR